MEVIKLLFPADKVGVGAERLGVYEKGLLRNILLLRALCAWLKLCWLG